MTEDKKIVIDLSQSQEASSAIKTSGLVQQEALERFQSLIRDIKGRIADFKESLKNPQWPMRTHDVITVDGVRGSGKTTFILSACHALLDVDQCPGKRHQDNSLKGLDFLDIIDPTLVETREHVFISIVAAIKRRVDEHRKACEQHCEHRPTYDEWSKSLSKLAGGLTILDGVGTSPLAGDDWLDAQYVLEKGLQNASSGAKLEQCFHRFVDCSLKYLGKDAFLLVFDDIDTDFSRGWDVLEIIRKYLTTPQLIVALSGDLKLYTLLAEKQQWERLGQLDQWKKSERLTGQKAVDDNRFLPIIHELKDQYLLKILKPANRIELRTLAHYTRQPYPLLVKRGWEKNEEAPRLTDVLDTFCQQALHIRSKAERERVCGLLLQRPVRTIIALLRTWDEATKEKEQDKTLPLDKATPIPGKESALYMGLAHVFLTGLTTLDFAPGDFDSFDPVRSIEKLLDNLITHDCLPEGAELRPIFSNDARDEAMLALGGYFAREMSRQPASFFQYMLKVCQTAELAREANSDKTLNAYRKHAKLDRLESTLTIARRYLSFKINTPYNPSSAKPAVSPGAVRLRARLENLDRVVNALFTRENDDSPLVPIHPHLKLFYNSLKDNQTDIEAESILNTAGTLAKGITSWQRDFIVLPFSTNLIHGASNQLYSIFNLIGAMGMLAEASAKAATNALDNTQQTSPDNNGRAFLEAMTLATQPTYYPAYTPDSKAAKTAASPLDDFGSLLDQVELPDSGEDKSEDRTIQPFLEAWSVWQQHFTAEKLLETVPAEIIARSWSRFATNLQAIAEELPSTDSFVGNLLHRWIVAFFHSVLLEEALAAHGSILPNEERLIATNIIKDDVLFISLFDKLKKLSPSRADPSNTKEWPYNYPLFAYIFSCPLWALYLNTVRWQRGVCMRHLANLANTRIVSNPSTFKKSLQVTYQSENLLFDNLHHLLNSLLVIGIDHLATDESIWESAFRQFKSVFKSRYNEIYKTKGNKSDRQVVIDTIRAEKTTLELVEPSLNMALDGRGSFYRKKIYPLFQKIVLDQ